MNCVLFSPQSHSSPQLGGRKTNKLITQGCELCTKFLLPMFVAGSERDFPPWRADADRVGAVRDGEGLRSQALASGMVALQAAGGANLSFAFRVLVAGMARHC